MPVNKDALGRYRIINRLLVDRKYVTKKQIIEVCSEELGYTIGQRTIEGDINQMKNSKSLGYQAPIKYCPRNKAYYYEDRNYSIDKIPINKKELEAIQFSISLLKQFKTTAFFEDMHVALDKLSTAMQIHRFENNFHKPDFIEMEEAPEIKGKEQLSTIIEAIKNKTVLKIHYCKFISDKEEEHIISPFYLKEYQNRWYVMGWHHNYQAYRTYGLDRITKINTFHTYAFHITDFDAKTYFRNVIGITAPEKAEAEEIMLKCTLVQGKYLESKPLHHSQKVISKDETSITFSVTLIPTYEFYAQVLSWGSDVEVLSPAKVRKHIGEILVKAVRLYKLNLD